MTENPTKKEISHFSLTSLSFCPHFQLRRGLALATFLSHAAFALLFCCLGSGICPFDFRSSALDHGHPYKTLLLCASSFNRGPIQGCDYYLKKKKKKSHLSIRFNGESTPPTQSTILPSSSLSSSLRARSTSSTSTIKRTLA